MNPAIVYRWTFIFPPFSYEGLDGLVMAEGLEAPRITDPNQVLVRVHAASVEPVDISILSGLGRHERPRTSSKGSSSSGRLVLGRDLSGVVVEVGINVTTLDVGDQVWAIVPLTARYTELQHQTYEVYAKYFQSIFISILAGMGHSQTT